MTMIFPVAPNATPRILSRADAPSLTKTVVLPAMSLSSALPGGETNDKAVTPAAPPSAVQMQIKELINEQAQALEDAARDDAEGQG